MNVNYLAVFVSAVAIFLLGALWYSPAMFAKKWVALQGKSMEEMSGGANPGAYIQVFICGLLVSVGVAVLLSHTPTISVIHAMAYAAFLWLVFAAATSYGTVLFSSKPKALWAIDSGFNLVSFMVAAGILAAWR